MHFIPPLKNFNTSYVLVGLANRDAEQDIKGNFNTSYVLVGLVIKFKIYKVCKISIHLMFWLDCNVSISFFLKIGDFNTSYVLVGPKFFL